MNFQHNERLRDKLSSAFVLGTLKGGARRRFESVLKNSAVLQREVAEWQDRLNPLAEFSAPAAPPARVWQHIERKLDLRRLSARTSQLAFWSGLRNDLSFWRGLGLFSTALATILFAILSGTAPQPAVSTTSYVAMLADDKGQAVIVVTGDAKQHKLIAKVVLHQALASNKSLELWAVPQNGAPRSLGLVNAEGSIDLPLPDNATPQSIPLLAVSLEPKGGSPNRNGPSGPILFKGAWIQI